MNLTSFARPVLLRRAKKIDRYFTHAEEIQRAVLARLIKNAAKTEWGQKYGYADLKSYEDFAAAVPLNDYETLKEPIDRMRHGEKDVLCKGRVKWYAKSSGTTNDKSKFIPVSKAYLKDTHYKGGADVVAL
jgi:hypothetical protein